MARPQSADAHRKVLDAALELVAERGIDATSMDAIAEASGVSKATIYKHWADKDALLLEMLAEASGLYTRPRFDSGNTRADMIEVLSYRVQEHADLRERLMPHVISYSTRNVSFGETWRNLVMNPAREELSRLIISGIQKGELRQNLDLDLALALLLGPVLYWKIFFKNKQQGPALLAEAVVDAFWRGFGA
jgi:AcrR family transcriptional regulator